MLIGCGPQAGYAVEILARTDRKVSRVFDPIGHRVGEQIGDIKVESFEPALLVQDQQGNRPKLHVLVCLRDNKLKSSLFRQLENKTEMINAVHPDCTIALTAEIERGSIINARTVIQQNARIGKGCMIHAGVIIEHDSVVNDFANLAPGVILTGGAIVGEGVTVNAGAIIAPDVKIGSYAMIGAGSLVLEDVPSGVLAHGSPAKVVRALG
jgi:acetyltransferase EpsM